ncbi:ATP-binding protein [Streptomyces ureilyticus]|uniref:ATP-binding protein n=1 Tax=Streptomyces ureilyticus TaxID=1775131 RepID=A0ABX0DTF1_9ACTN|nr:ATP-binding protein [Streptomyces ureilyticus]NGO43159.1 ATP-binding protein [Streptomyces ureilyticus]
MTDGQSRSPAKGPAGAEKVLAAAVLEGGCSSASVALPVGEPARRARPEEVAPVAVGEPAGPLRTVVPAQPSRASTADRSPVLPRLCAVGAAEESGRGLALVAALSDDWGVARPALGTTGKSVWFTLTLREPS